METYEASINEFNRKVRIHEEFYGTDLRTSRM